MSDVSLSIMDRVYRLAVAPENEEKLRRCGEELDRKMRAVRDAGRVLGYDQIAVMVALDLIWSNLDRDERDRAAAERLESLAKRCEAELGDGTAPEPEETQAPADAA